MKAKSKTIVRKNLTYTGINIQFPISRLILTGQKTIETRLYSIPESYIGQKLLIIETPGPAGDFKARVVGFIVFGPSFKYSSAKEFYQDSKKHCVTPESPWHWTEGLNKWGWPIEFVEEFKKSKPAPAKKGIKFTKDIDLASL